MPIYQTGGYEVNPSAIPKVKQAIEEFVEYIKANEPGTEMYLAWQEAENPAKFLHLFIFKDEEAHKIHSSSDAVRKFGSVFAPELVGGDVTFTDYEMPAGKREKAK